MRERRLGKVTGGTFGEIFLRDAVEVSAQEALPQLGAGAAAGARDALDECDTCGRDAAEQAAIVWSNWRVHA
ncbi:MAG TPA: hypothetical protein VLX08_04140, partial [Steroidobacteraceae bacterium]|nr:hypothetical protein [Steroidobacteraceae bacterium]